MVSRVDALKHGKALNMAENTAVVQFEGACPICERPVSFSSRTTWYRDWLKCSRCQSIPRERALALVLEELRPDWRNCDIHESSPTPRGISPKLKRECRQYVETQFYPGKPLGQVINGFRNENAEKLTFGDRSFDLFISLDVMEHVNHPDRVFQEAARTLKPGGICLFTTPTYKHRVTTERRSLYREDGSVDYLGFEPEYHGNPVSAEGALVTFHFGYDLPELISQWSGLDTRVYRFHDKHHGIIGEYTEVYACWRR